MSSNFPFVLSVQSSKRSSNLFFPTETLTNECKVLFRFCDYSNILQQLGSRDVTSLPSKTVHLSSFR